MTAQEARKITEIHTPEKDREDFESVLSRIKEAAENGENFVITKSH